MAMRFGVCGYQRDTVEASRFLTGPFNCLETTYGASHESVYMMQSEVIGKQRVCPCEVADGKMWKPVVVWFACLRVYRQRACGAVA